MRKVGESYVKYVLLAWQQQMQWAISDPNLSLGRPRIHDASKVSSFYLVDTGINEKVEWMGIYL